MEKEKMRDETIDTARGIAILSMIFFFFSGDILVEPHSWNHRLFGTFAAPMFVLLAGMMVGLSIHLKNHPQIYFVKRGLLIILASGIILDILIWRYLPFISMEVLYLIGIAIPLTAFFHKLGRLQQYLAIAIVFGITPFLQSIFGYREMTTDLSLFTDSGTFQVFSEEFREFIWPTFLKQIFIDGWFPVFPWVGFAFIGYLFAVYRWQVKLLADFSKPPIVYASLSILIFGAGAWYANPGPLYVREGFSEMFYPVTIGYALTALGIIMLILAVIDRNPKFKIYRPLQIMGRYSLTIYFLHWAIAEYIILSFTEEAQPWEHFAWYIAVVVICLGVAYGVRYLKQVWKPTPLKG